MNASKILIIDDQAALRRLLSDFLTGCGYETKTGENGLDGLFIQEQWPADLVTVDLSMPILDGLGFIKKAHERWPDLPIIVVSGIDAVDKAVEALRLGARDFITKPIESLSLVQNTVEKALESAELIRQNRDYQQNLEKMVHQRTEELQEIKQQLLFSLGKASEYRDNETGRHVIRVGKMAKVLGHAMGMPEATSSILMEAAPLHDIGKIGISDTILLKPGRLTEEEIAIMHQHCAIGCAILRPPSAESLSDEELFSDIIKKANNIDDIPLLDMARVIALCHHEHWDGNGYPNGLAGDDIPLVARIVAVIDVYDALGSERPYKKAFTEEKCQQILRSETGTHFDPKVIDALFAHIDEIVAIKKEWMD